jgi:hypothetical protein
LAFVGRCIADRAKVRHRLGKRDLEVRVALDELRRLRELRCCKRARAVALGVQRPVRGGAGAACPPRRAAARRPR